MVDTRKDKRAPVSLKVRFKSATVDEFIEHYSRDVSRGGIFIKSSQPMPVGTLLKFQFQLKDESALIRGVGRVVWTRAEEDAGDEMPAGMGIKFIKMDNDSKVMVERIVDSHAPGDGTYERGRSTATTIAATSSNPPPDDSATPGIEGDPFFPNLPPADLPLPEDRTAVRQAAQFLAAALTEGGTDEAAAREAQHGAEEAKRRTAEIEAERRLEAEQKKRKGPPPPAEPLPSMIIDPSLDARAGTDAERPTDVNLKPVGDDPREAEARKRLAAESDEEREPDTEPPPAPANTTTTTSIPQALAPRSRPNYLPVAIIAFVLATALAVTLRGGPKELPVEPLDERAEPAANPPEPVNVDQAPEEQPPAAEQPEPVVEATADAAVAEPVPLGPVTKLSVISVPRGAQISVGGEVRGVAPLTVDLTAGVPQVVSARAPGYAEASEEVTPSEKSGPLRFKLKALPYVVEAETTPPGASINVGGHKGTTPVTLKLDQAPTTDLSVTAKLAGHRNGHLRLPLDSFTEADGAMRAKVALALESNASAPSTQATPSETTTERPAPKPRPKGAPKAASAAEPSPAPEAKSGESEDTPSAKPAAEAAPAPAPSAAEAPPKPAPEAPANPAEAAPKPAAEAPAKPDVPSNPFDGQ